MARTKGSRNKTPKNAEKVAKEKIEEVKETPLEAKEEKVEAPTRVAPGQQGGRRQ